MSMSTARAGSSVSPAPDPDCAFVSGQAIASTGFRPMAKREMFVAADGGGPVDVEPGTVPVAVDLTVTWSFA